MEQEKAANRAARKLEAKKLKHQRIVSAGGKRPRPPPSVDDDKSSPTNPSHKAFASTEFKKGTKFSSSSSSPSNNNKKKKRKTKDSSKNDHKQHHFGRVMDNAPCPNQPRFSTLSIAIPGSIVSNAQTQELRTHLVGQIARASAIYHVDEIVVFNDGLGKEIRPHYRNQQYRNKSSRGEKEFLEAEKDTDNQRSSSSDKKETMMQGKEEKEKETKDLLVPSTDPHVFMARILQYCECPQYLRRHFFPMHPDLQFAGLLSPLDAPHHVRALDRCEYREGVVTEKRGLGEQGGSLVNCGIRNQLVEIDRVLSPGIRCTVRIDPKAYATPGKSMKGTVVSPSEPREKDGTYWGYQTRMASSIKAIFDEAPFEGGYDLKIGTSERGDVCVDDENFGQKYVVERGPFQHAIIVLGGVAGIEECVDADETILDISGNDSRKMFDMWVNICPFQGSRTIRTEEALLISLAKLRPLLFSKHNEESEQGIDPKKHLNTSGRKDSLPSVVDFSDDEPSEESSDEE